MSEDTDERMERATRIRQMREGQREGVGGDDDTDDSGDDTEETQERSQTSDANEDSSSDDETADQEADDSAMEQSVETNVAETDPGEHDGPDKEEATAAAQRAAEAAAQIGGGATEEAASTGAATEAPQAAEGAQATKADQSSPADVAATQMQGPTGVELPDQESLQAAMAEEGTETESGDAAGPVTGRGGDAQGTATSEEAVRVLEFTLGEEHYCLDISHVEEIVKRDSITRVPNTPDYVEGVVDLRGQITTILDPKLLLDIDKDGPESLLVVFEPEEFEDQGAIGWVVDEVRQVAPVLKSEVSAAPVDADYVEGVIDRDDEEEFVIWTNPEVAIKLATGARDED